MRELCPCYQYRRSMRAHLHPRNHWHVCSVCPSPSSESGQKVLRDQRKELQELMVSHMTGGRGMSVDPDLAEKTAKVGV